MVLMLMMGTRRNGSNLTKYLLHIFFNEPGAKKPFFGCCYHEISNQYEIRNPLYSLRYGGGITSLIVFFYCFQCFYLIGNGLTWNQTRSGKETSLVRTKHCTGINLFLKGAVRETLA